MAAQGGNIKWETIQNGLSAPHSSGQIALLDMPSEINIGSSGVEVRTWRDANRTTVPDGQLRYMTVTTSDSRMLQLGRYQPIGTGTGAPVFMPIGNLTSGTEYVLTYVMFADQGNNVQFGIKSLTGASGATFDLIMRGTYMS
jgi:hypothetical protein